MYLKCWPTMSLLLVAVIGGIAGSCGSAGGARLSGGRDHGKSQLGAVALRSLERRNDVVAVLATGRLVDSGAFVIVLVREGDNYEVAFATEGPARKQNRPANKRRMVFYGGGGGVSIGGRMGARPVELVVGGGCVGRRPYGLAYGILRGGSATVTAIAEGRSIRFAKVAIPSRFRASGDVVYALLMPGKNDIVVRNRKGKIVSSEWRSGSPSSGACSRE